MILPAIHVPHVSFPFFLILDGVMLEIAMQVKRVGASSKKKILPFFQSAIQLYSKGIVVVAT